MPQAFGTPAWFLLLLLGLDLVILGIALKIIKGRIK